ncbi:MAG: glycine cleavage system protein GcvH [Acidimicrobiaceae bacterium]|nr:glycine cleavage system protein GcvH [Acidimicrobiaceae bacterium]
MQIPSELHYSRDHEWASASNGVVRVGITDYAQDALGDVVFVDLPKVGTVLALSATLGEVESTKSVSEIYAPVAGTVVAINEVLVASPELVNSDPYGAGWLCDISTTDTADFDALLDAEAYHALTNN